VDLRAPSPSVLVWATRPGLADALAETLAEPGRTVRLLEQDADLSSADTLGVVLVAEFEPRFAVQAPFVRGPLVLLDPERAAPRPLSSRACAVVGTPSEAALAVDRFFEHRRLSIQAAGRRAMPGRCSRCGRHFDAVKAGRGSPARRFVRFGAVALCGSCVEALRRLLRTAETAVVEGDA
jgi:hypothetical protein